MFLPDEKIVRSLKKGNESAFRMLFDKYHRKLYHFSRKMGQSHEDAEGIIQEVFIIVWKNKATLNEELSLPAYLFTITKRVVLKKVKRKILEDEYLANQQNSQSHFHQQTEDYIIFTNLLDQANKGLDQLSPGRKQIFMLSKQQGLSNEEIAEKLNISKRTVENQLYRATKELRDFMGPDFKEK
ncbi:RNA polymerase ECF-type sigma factor [Fulvivirga imtechensis AK7]|uniref:RNA polymerase ECF-type sigma factor n=1 Tax=Fulvivirga imtechensis AK7 TaxID=1237149 RepID=L8JQK4_9BACT|nr:RNA polymerase sigma-70 factor [Fulvivirga imtechensis]ELR70503.1 RNA polymerase ECF-type sigma factor [Fulvivirga imtechensis AK7]